MKILGTDPIHSFLLIVSFHFHFVFQPEPIYWAAPLEFQFLLLLRAARTLTQQRLIESLIPYRRPTNSNNSVKVEPIFLLAAEHLPAERIQITLVSFY